MDRESLARTLALRHRATVVITGEVDIVAGNQGLLSRQKRERPDGRMSSAPVAWPPPSSPLLPPSSLITAMAAACALARLYGIASELAAKQSRGPTSFKEQLFDCLYNLDQPTIERMQRVET